MVYACILVCVTNFLRKTQFGDGIMSAIDFKAHVDKVEDPKGDRVKITLDGKFLPYSKDW